ncbi:hypothetical protein J6590_083878 [Homalodisca vitripennis]|nr:hypothetical protein J6590_083878 [Homalodisca vitripennis]
MEIYLIHTNTKITFNTTNLLDRKGLSCTNVLIPFKANPLPHIYLNMCLCASVSGIILPMQSCLREELCPSTVKRCFQNHR